MGTICPYCNIEVDEVQIELEDGCCPECGSVVTISSLSDEDGPAVFEEDDDFFDNIEFDDDEDEDY